MAAVDVVDDGAMTGPVWRRLWRRPEFVPLSPQAASRNCTFSAQLDFPPLSSTSSPKLAYAPDNAPIHGYEDALTGVLTRLDAVESFGDCGVRRSRKEAVKAVGKELEELDSRMAEAWRQQSEPEVLAAQELVEAELVATVDPLAVPLPDDSGVENRDEEMSEAASEALPSLEHSDAPIESPAPAPKALLTLA